MIKKIAGATVVLWCALVLVESAKAADATKQVKKSPLKVFILAGQSNMQGQGIVSSLAEMKVEKPGTLAKAFASHPQTPDRIGKSQEEIAKILPAKSQYVPPNVCSGHPLG